MPTGLGFTGHVNDADTGLVYMQQRYYDPIAGRFLSVDPIATDANTGSGFNLYEYANNNPYRYTDPDGLDPKCSAGMAGCTVTVFSGTPQKTGTPQHDTASQKVSSSLAHGLLLPISICGEFKSGCMVASMPRSTGSLPKSFLTHWARTL